MTGAQSDPPAAQPRHAMPAQTSRQPTETAAAAAAPPLYVSGGCEIDLARRELRIDGSVVPLGDRAFAIIEILVQSAGELVTKDELANRIWPGAIVLENTMHVHAAALRKALGKYRSLLKTEARRGYRLLGSWAVHHHPPVAPPVSHHPGFSYQPVRLVQESPATNLPALPSRLVGRAAVVQRLNDLMSAYRIVTVTGPGGIGKTALALKIGHKVRGVFAEGAWLVELGSLSDPELVPTAVATAIGLKPAGERISAETVARAIGDQKLLLILDNCEHVIEAAAGLAEMLLRQCPQAAILATSRELLKIDGECVFRVPPLDVPAPENHDVNELLAHPAVAFFVTRAQSLGADFTVSEANLQEIAGICRRLDGIPLAIEFAASTAAALGISQVGKGLHDRFALLTRGRRTAVARHRTLRATLDWSYDSLPEAEQLLLRRLAVFPAGFSLDAAAAVMGDSGLDRSAVTDGIANLVAKSLVALDKSDAPARWRLLETVRAYAAEKLAAQGEAGSVARQHAVYFRDLCAPAGIFRGPLSVEDLAQRSREIANVRAALDWCFAADGDAAIGIDLTAAYAPVWMDLSLVVECSDRCEQALGRVGGEATAVTPQLMWLRIALGSSLVVAMRSPEHSRRVLTEAVAMADALNDRHAHVRALSALVTAYSHTGEYAEAQVAMEQLRRVAEHVDDPGVAVVADRLLGTTLVTAGRPRAARQSLERVLLSPGVRYDPRNSAWHDSEHRAMARAMLARALWMQGLVDRAFAEAQASLEDLRANDHPLALCRVLYYGICRIAPMIGEFAAAEHSTARLIETATALNAPFWVTAGRLLQGRLAAEHGEFDKGLAILVEAFDTCRQTGWSISYQEFQAALAVALAGVGYAGPALDAVDGAIAHAGSPENGRRWFVPELLRIKGEIMLRPGQDHSLEAAETCFRAAQQMAAEQEALFWELRIALSLARLRVTQGRPDAARQLLAPVYERFTEGFGTADLRAARAMLDTLR